MYPLNNFCLFFQRIKDFGFKGFPFISLYELGVALSDEIDLVEVFETLEHLGLSRDKTPEFYLEMTPNMKAKHFEKLRDNFFKMELLNCHYDLKKSALFTRALFGGKGGLALLDYGFNPYHPEHEAHFNVAFECCLQEDELSVDELLLKTAEKKIQSHPMEHYLQYHSAELIEAVFSIQKRDQKKQGILLEMIRRLIACENLPQGPLRMTRSTRRCEGILSTFALNLVEDVHVQQDNLDEYIMSIRFKTALGKSVDEIINLSLLLKNANFSHLSLSDPQLASIDQQLTLMYPEWSANPNKGEGPLALLPLSLRKALMFYTDDDKYYLDINRLFRGQKLKGSRLANDEEISSNYILTCFLIGSLIQIAINRLPLLLNEPQIYREEKALLSRLMKDLRKIKTAGEYQRLLSKRLANHQCTEKEYQFLTGRFEELAPLMGGYSSLYRVEFLKSVTVRARERKVLSLPALTSTSHWDRISDEFGEEGLEDSKLTIFKNAPSNLFSIHSLSHLPHEREVLLSAGLQVINKVYNKQIITALIVNTPMFQKDHYWPDVALSHAYKNYLSQRYEDLDETIDIGNFYVARPNHGLAHTFRVMEYVEPVVHYFSLYAEDESFRQFCQTISSDTLQWLKIAAAFRVTGRNSEVGFHDNPDLYTSYKRASANHFREFVKTIPSFAKRFSSLVDALEEVIFYLGNPEYEAKYNREQNQNKKNLRNYCMRILDCSHNLDLARCKDSDSYWDAIEGFTALVHESNEQDEALIMLIRYATHLMKAHGDALCCELDDSDCLIDSEPYYKARYGKISHSRRYLIESSRTVQAPVFEQKPSGMLKLL